MAVLDKPPWRIPVATFMARNGDGSHGPTGYRLELDPATGGYFCSCDSPVVLVSSGGLMGCQAEASHGCRNQEEVHAFLRGLGGAALKRINQDRTRGRDMLRV